MDAKNSPQIIEHISKSTNFTPFDTKWVPCSARFVVVGVAPKGTGLLHVYELDHGKLKLISQTEKKDGIKCGTFGASHFEKRHFATGNYNGDLNIWDLEKLESPVFSTKAHSALINCIDGIGGLNIGNGAPEIVTGSRDGCVKIWDPRTTESVASLEPASGQSVRDCWAVAFGNSYNDTERMVCCGYENGDLKLLDLRVNKLLWETNVKSGIVNVEFDRKDIKMNKLVVTTLESRFRVYDMRTFHPTEGYTHLVEKAHKSTVWLGRHLPQNRDVFTTCGGNGSVNLYKYVYPDSRSLKDLDGHEKGVIGRNQLLNTKKFSDQPVISFDWHPDKQGLCVMSCLDQTVKVGIVTKLNKIQ